MAESDDLDSGFKRVCSTEDVPSEGGYVADVDGLEIAIFEDGGSYFAIGNVCPHQGGPLGDGKCEGGVVYCPWHGYEFDLETGNHAEEFSDDLSTPTYDVALDGDDIYVRIT